MALFGSDFPEGSYATHPGCDVHIDGYAMDLAETVKTMGEPSAGGPYAPPIDLAPWAARTIPVSYDWTFQPCGHMVRIPVGSEETVITVHTPTAKPT